MQFEILKTIFIYTHLNDQKNFCIFIDWILKRYRSISFLSQFQVGKKSLKLKRDEAFEISLALVFACSKWIY